MSLDDTTLKNIGQRIKEARTQRKVSQERLAEISNLSATYIGRLERGEKTPSLETLIVLAQSMDVSVLDLLVDLETKRGKRRIKSRIKNLVDLL